MPKKQNLAMLEAPPEPKSIAYVGPPYKTLPPIGSAPPTGRPRQSTTPRKLSTAPGAPEKTPRDERPPFDRTNSMPPDFPESVQYQSGHTTRQTVKTDGEATVGESVGTADGRHQPHADERLNTDDRFFMTQVIHLFFSFLFFFFPLFLKIVLSPVLCTSDLESLRKRQREHCALSKRFNEQNNSCARAL